MLDFLRGSQFSASLDDLGANILRLETLPVYRFRLPTSAYRTP